MNQTIRTILVSLTLSLTTLTGGLYAQRMRPQPPPPEKKADDRGNKRGSAGGKETLSRHFSIVKDTTGYNVFAAPLMVFNYQDPLTSDISYSSSASWFGFGLGGQAMLEKGYIGELGLYYSRLDSVSVNGFSFNDINQGLWQIQILGGRSYYLNTGRLEFSVGFTIYNYSNREVFGSEEENSDNTSLFLHLRTLYNVDCRQFIKSCNKDLSFGAGLSLQYNLTPGYRRLVGVNRLTDISLLPEFRVSWRFGQTTADAEKTNDTTPPNNGAEGGQTDTSPPPAEPSADDSGPMIIDPTVGHTPAPAGDAPPAAEETSP